MGQVPTAERKSRGDICKPGTCAWRFCSDLTNGTPTCKPLVILTWLNPKSMDTEVSSPDREAGQEWGESENGEQTI